jgi:hypothetical protein
MGSRPGSNRGGAHRIRVRPSSQARAPLRDPAEAVRLLQRQGCRPLPTLPLPPPPPGSDRLGAIVMRFDTLYA